MDEVNGQLELITSGDMLQIEKQLKITICKERAIEKQANDTGPNFKFLKEN